jgi:hypothetical protein
LQNQKGNAVTGGALSDEAVASTDVFDGKGLQQFYSPSELATLVKRVIGSRVAALDLTAGDGSLLKSLDPPYSYGVELDADQYKNAEGSYHGIVGDIQQVFPLLKLGTQPWDAVVCNPPFGKKWSDPTIRGGKPLNSAVATFIYGSRLLSEQGQFIFVCGAARFFKQIADLPEAKGIYAVVECDDLGANNNFALPCVVAFGIAEGNRSAESVGYETRKFDLQYLDLAAPWIEELREKALGRRNYVATSTYTSYELPDIFKTIQKEHDRRTQKRLKTDREFDCLLVGGKMIQWLPSGFAIRALQQNGEYYTLNGLNGQSLNYFVTNERIWRRLIEQRDLGTLTIEPRLEAIVDDLLTEARKEVCPLYVVKPTQRLGFLTDVDQLQCTTEDAERGFHAGEFYRLHTETFTKITRDERVVESKKNPGDFEVKQFITQAKVMKIRVGHFTFEDSGKESSENIQYFLDHFNIPDPGEVGTRHPNEIAALVKLAHECLDDFEANSRKWEEKNPTVTPFSRREFQVQDIARLAFKGSGLLSWEQGLGKTMGGLLFTEMMVRLGAQDARLFITPGDLIPQWEREMERFLGKKPTIIKPRPVIYTEVGEDGKVETKKTNGIHGQVVALNRHLKDGGTGLYLTYYEALTLAGMRGRNKPLPVVTVREKTERRIVKGTGRYGNYYFSDDEDSSSTYTLTPPTPGAAADRVNADGQSVWLRPKVPCKVWHAQHDTEIPKMPDGTYREIHSGYIHPVYENYIVKTTSKEICPECEADTRNGWNGTYCEAEKDDGSKCGYAHVASKIRPAASYMSQAFRHGCIVMDELTMIQGDDSKRSIALRGLYAKHRLGMTGTPIKNFVAQAFWLLWWCLGNGSKRFGYDYDGGRTRFENDFSVVEWVSAGGKKLNRKALPEVTNLSVLWRLLSSSVIRRRKEETNEVLVPKYYHEIHVPLGISQTELLAKMLKDFPELFKEKYPESKIVAAGMEKVMAPLIGLNSKLDYGLTLPEADPDKEWWGVDGVTNWTPASYKTIELAMALAKKGRKVLIGSNLVATSKWLADQLCDKDVKALHILDEDGTTTNKENRAKRVYSFQTDEVQVFCAGVKAIRLGHNLDKANAVIINGLDWDYETFDQFIARVHRLTSQTPVDVFVILPSLDGQDTLTTRKWGILNMKGAAANLALDGRLIEKNEATIDKAAIIHELIEKGIRVTDEAVDEVSVVEAWEATPQLADYIVPEGLIPVPPTEDESSCESALTLSTSSSDDSGVPDLEAAAAMVLEKLADEWAAVEDTEAFVHGDELDDELDALEAGFTEPDASMFVQYDAPIGPLNINPLAAMPPPVQDIPPEGMNVVYDDKTGIISDAPDTLDEGFTVDDVAVAMNDAEMPTTDAMTLVMEQLAAMQAQMAALESKNAALEARLNTDEQLTLGLEV